MPHRRPFELYVLGLVDHTHPALAESFGDAVMRDGSNDHGAPKRLAQIISLLTMKKARKESRKTVGRLEVAVGAGCSRELAVAASRRSTGKSAGLY